MKKTAEWWEIYADMLDLPDGQWQQRLQACAEACSNSYSLHLYRQCAKKAVSIEDFFMALAEAFADMEVNKLSEGRYEVCYRACGCDFYRQKLCNDPRLCMCSKKSMEYNLSDIFGKENILVELKESILAGREKCRFLVLVNERTENRWT
ncbi:MAG: hypothetical protein DBY39_01085 [Clostridiales bacterium]|nr:MAG: hypothetical protein DBY39_01085 [Clostridiales bacterium]